MLVLIQPQPPAVRQMYLQQEHCRNVFLLIIIFSFYGPATKDRDLFCVSVINLLFISVTCWVQVIQSFALTLFTFRMLVKMVTCDASMWQITVAGVRRRSQVSSGEVLFCHVMNVLFYILVSPGEKDRWRKVSEAESAEEAVMTVRLHTEKEHCRCSCCFESVDWELLRFMAVVNGVTDESRVRMRWWQMICYGDP